MKKNKLKNSGFSLDRGTLGIYYNNFQIVVLRLKCFHNPSLDIAEMLYNQIIIIHHFLDLTAIFSSALFKTMMNHCDIKTTTPKCNFDRNLRSCIDHLQHHPYAQWC